MDKNKIKNCLENVYNCPFLLLVLVTSCLAFAFPGTKNVLKMDQKITNACLEESGDVTGEKAGIGSLTFDITSKIGRNNEFVVSAAEAVSSSVQEETTENEGERRKENDDIKDDGKRNAVKKELESVQNEREEREPATKFVEYTPVSVDSRYYSDAGKVALTTDYDYVMENDSYFNDAAFLGDSRTLGISDYVGFEGADFFCDNGMTIYKLLEDGGVTYQKTGEKVDMKVVLQEKQYGKIYIMLGMNELGYGNTTMYLKQYLKVLHQIQEWQPEAIIYIMANLHVSQEKNNMETEFNNVNINDKNVASARLANGRDIFYLDCNPLFTDEEGYLQADLTFDGVHLYAQHYDKWREFLLSHGVEREEESE